MEGFVGYVCYGMADLFSGYDTCTLNVCLHNLTTFQCMNILGWCTVLPQDITSVVSNFVRCTHHILVEEVPKYARARALAERGAYPPCLSSCSSSHPLPSRLPPCPLRKSRKKIQASSALCRLFSPLLQAALPLICNPPFALTPIPFQSLTTSLS